ncbi:MAG: sugar phosphate isomerase/epimerase [Bacteroidota bacterium]
MESRRSFIKKSSVLAAGSFFLAGCGNATPANRAIGVQLYTVRNQISKNLAKTLEKVAEVGYTHIESAGHGASTFYGEKALAYKKLLKSFNLTPISGHYSTGIANPDDVGTLSNNWEKALDEMNEIGQKYAVLAYLREEERTSLDDYKRVVDLLNTAGEKAKKQGIQLCYHNHDFEFQTMEGEVPMYYILDNTEPDLLKMELDLYWITKAKFDVKDFFGKYSGRIPLWHVKDMGSDGKFADVGSGSVDFKTIFANQELAGLEYFFVEHDNSKDPLKSIETSIGYIQNNLL